MVVHQTINRRNQATNKQYAFKERYDRAIFHAVISVKTLKKIARLIKTDKLTLDQAVFCLQWLSNAKSNFDYMSWAKIKKWFPKEFKDFNDAVYACRKIERYFPLKFIVEYDKRNRIWNKIKLVNIENKSVKAYASLSRQYDKVKAKIPLLPPTSAILKTKNPRIAAKAFLFYVYLALVIENREFANKYGDDIDKLASPLICKVILTAIRNNMILDVPEKIDGVISWKEVKNEKMLEDILNRMREALINFIERQIEHSKDEKTKMRWEAILK